MIGEHRDRQYHLFVRSRQQKRWNHLITRRIALLVISLLVLLVNDSTFLDVVSSFPISINIGQQNRIAQRSCVSNTNINKRKTRSYIQSPLNRKLIQQLHPTSSHFPVALFVHKSNNINPIERASRIVNKPLLLNENKPNESNHKQRIQSSIQRRLCKVALALFISAGVFGMNPGAESSILPNAYAAPPFAVIAEELGYFPIRNPTTGDVVYVPQRVKRTSSEQAIELSKRLKEKNVVMAGTYWCPHTTRQKELLGNEAFQNIRYIECSPKGYNGNPMFCLAKQVDGYPTWIFPDGTQIAGERPLSVLASAVGMKNFQDDIEQNIPPTLGSEACK